MSDSTPAHRESARLGVSAVAAAFCIWGLLPLFIRQLEGLSNLQIAAWRYAMGAVTIVVWLALLGKWPELCRVVQQPALMLRLAGSGGLLAMNWSIYAWGVIHGQVLMTSLGYYINPLVNVLLGMLFLAERMNPLQWVAVALAALAVTGMTLDTGHLPWMALLLACSFSTYGLVRKTTPVAPMIGLACESLVYGPLGVCYLLFGALSGATVWPESIHARTFALLSGVITMVPLSMFHFGTKRINYITVGMLQYIGPTLQFLIAHFLFKEALTPRRLMCYGLIWTALVIYAGDGLWRNRQLLKS